MKENFQIINNIYPKTYGRKRGKKSKVKILNYKNHLKKYSITKIPNKKNIILEIGSGNGENVIKLSKLYPKKLIIACEVYIDGNASLISFVRKLNIQKPPSVAEVIDWLKYSFLNNDKFEEPYRKNIGILIKNKNDQEVVIREIENFENQS